MNYDFSKLDETSRRVYGTVNQIYNTVAESLKPDERRSPSVQATAFLVRHTFTFADAALILIADGQPLPASALIRTCIEAQARANHIVSFTGEEREKTAREFLRLFEVGKRYFTGLSTKAARDQLDPSLLVGRSQEELEGIRQMVVDFDEAAFKSAFDEYGELNRAWSYSKIIGTKSFKDPNWNKRTAVQILQQVLHLSYVESCFAVHPHPMSVATEKLVTAKKITRDAAVTAICVVTCYLTAAGLHDRTNLQAIIDEYSSYLRDNVYEFI